MISAQVVADSKNEFGNRITTMVVTMPRIILAEFNTHRMFSRNTSSSRAIPFKKMLKSVMENPFIPIAFQKDHAGMQGTEYFSPDEKFSVGRDLFEILASRFKFKEGEKVDEDLLQLIAKVMNEFDGERTLKEWWLLCRDRAVECATLMFVLGVTKQLANRIIEPFGWVTDIMTATEFENFFALRCSRYEVIYKDIKNVGPKPPLHLSSLATLRSRKSVLNDPFGRKVEQIKLNNGTWVVPYGSERGIDQWSDLDWLQANHGQAEIHMMALAEAMWDAYQESTPKQLKAGEWHIPFEDKIVISGQVAELRALTTGSILDGTYEQSWYNNIVKISTVMAARTSYTVVGEDQKPLSYQRMIEIHDQLLAADPKHMSPFEHCARTMDITEHRMNISHRSPVIHVDGGHSIPHVEEGWCGNFRGFIQYRKTIKGENITV